MKYKLTKNTKEHLGTTLHQIEALKDFGKVTKGDLGGWIEKESNLSQDGDAWVFDNAWVSDNARVFDNAWVSDNARVSDNASVRGDAIVYGRARVYGNASVFGDSVVCGEAWLYGDLKIKSGYFFGIRYQEEEIKFKKLDDNYDLVYKGDAEFGEDEEEMIDVKISKSTLEELKKQGIKINNK